MGVIFHGFSASRPTELALQEDNWALKADNQRQRTLLFQARATAASSSACWNIGHAQHWRTLAAFTASKRGCMMRDMQAMVNDYLEEHLVVGSVANIQKAALLVEDVSSVYDTSMDKGMEQGVLTIADAERLYCAADALSRQITCPSDYGPFYQ